jgi:hypothetical protein
LTLVRAFARTTAKILPLTIRRTDRLLRGARYVLRFGESSSTATMTATTRAAARNTLTCGMYGAPSGTVDIL